MLAAGSTLPRESAPGAEWTEGHKKEETFQQCKRVKHLISAVLDRSIPAEKCSTALLAVVVSEAERRIQTHKSTLQKHVGGTTS